MKKAHTCLELGICQGLGPDQCPDCDSFECSVPCAEPPRPTFPFAPGVIERIPASVYTDADGDWLPLSAGETLQIIALMFVAATVSILLVGYVA
jgi:hypothetical protein